MTQLAIATRNVQVNKVGASWVQDNKSLYGSFQIPGVKVTSPLTGQSGTTIYELGKLANFMQGLRKVRPGMSRGTSRDIKGGEVRLTVDNYETPLLDRCLYRPLENRFEDLRSKLIPGLQGQAMVSMDKKLAAFCQDVAIWGAAKTFTNGPLQSNSPLMLPVEEINNELMELEHFNMFERTCIMDITTRTALRQNTAYRDGANSQNMLTDELFEAKFKSNHNIDKLIVLGSANNRARTGQTPNIKSTARGLLWFGMTDPNMSYNISANPSDSTQLPDGALVLAYDQLPTADTFPKYEQKLEYFRSSVSFGFANPRKLSDDEAMGFFFDPASILINP